MNSDTERRVPVAYDMNERGIERVCPDHAGLCGFRELVKKSFYTADEPVNSHVHPGAVELCYAYRGAQYYTVGGREYALQAGDVFLSYPDERHSGGGQAQGKGSLLYYMIVDTTSELSRFLGLNENEGPALAAMLMGLPRCFHVGYELKPYFDEMLRVYHQRPPLAPLMMRSQFCLLVERLVAAAAEARRPNQSDIRHALNAIEDKLPGVPQIRDLARIVGLSESYFKQKFRQEIGVPPAKYIMQRRIALAQQMLMGRRSITETAYLLGFSSSQHFATYFKAYTRQTPSEWRRSV